MRMAYPKFWASLAAFFGFINVFPIFIGIMRNFLADAVGLRSAHRFEFVWVLNFPLFTPDPFTGHLESSHHPFTAPIPEHEEQLRKGDNLDQIEGLAISRNFQKGTELQYNFDFRN